MTTGKRAAPLVGAQDVRVSTEDMELIEVMEKTLYDEALRLIQKPLKLAVHDAVMAGIVAASHVEPEPAPTVERQPQKRRQARPVTTRKDTLEKPREGGRCAAVWDELDKLADKFGDTPTLQRIQAVAERKGWNENNTRIEYYRWRRAHGVTGHNPEPLAVGRKRLGGGRKQGQKAANAA